MDFKVLLCYVSGLLTEPGNKAMSVAIFGYGVTDRVWRTFVVDFEKAIPSKCKQYCHNLLIYLCVYLIIL